MKRLVCSAAIATALLGASAIPSRASTFENYGANFDGSPPLDFSLGTVFTLKSSESVTVAGSVSGISSSAYTLSFGTLGGPPSTTISTSNWSFTETLAAATYELLFAGTAPAGVASSYSGTITIGSSAGGDPPAAPIPGSLVLFLSGLGLLGFWGWTKGRKAGLGSAPLEAAAC